MLFLSFYHQAPASKTVPSQRENQEIFYSNTSKSTKTKTPSSNPRRGLQKKEETKRKEKEKEKCMSKYVYYKNGQKQILILLIHIIFLKCYSSKVPLKKKKKKGSIQFIKS